MSESRGVSIIVVNYNNERFLAAAIDSALAQDHPHCEVVVVDDRSTDNSRTIIGRYGVRIRPVLRETNGHQLAALNSAWPLARYPILIFLDSDDLLVPHAARTLAGAWTTSTVKAQFPLASIDEAGRLIGHVAPKYPPDLDTATLKAQLLRIGQSYSSPGSGNAYSRALLDRVSHDGGFDLEVAARIVEEYEQRINVLRGKVSKDEGQFATENRADRRLQRIALDAERRTITRMRAAGDIPDDIFRSIEYDLDLAALRLS